MNNKKNSKNKIDQDHSNSAWAEIIEQWDQPSLSGITEEDRLDQSVDTNSRATLAGRVNLNSDLLDDLELDGQLRILGSISDSQKSFVDSVVAQTHPESNLPQQNCSRLPVLKPSFPLEASRLEGGKVAEPSASSLSDLSSATLSRKSPHRSSAAPFAALFAALVTTFLIGCFLGSMWWFGSDDKIAVPSLPNTPSNTTITQSDQPKVIPLQSIESRKDVVEIFPDSDVDTPALVANEALVEKSQDQESSSGLTTAMKEQLDEEDWNQFFGGTNEANANSSLVDLEKEFDAAVDFADVASPPIGDTRNLEPQKVEIATADGPIWDSKLEWNLDLNFYGDGVGFFALNGEPVQSILLKDNAIFMLRQIAVELQRRVQFMENRLGSQVNGSISVGGAKFRFDRISQLDQTVKAVDRHLATLDIRSPTLNELMIIRDAYRKGIVANLNRFNSIDLAGKNLSFYTEDEAFTICSVLSSSEAVLRELANQRLNWEKCKKIQSTESKRAITIAPRDFLLFAKSGVLHLPDPKFSDPSLVSIQNLGPSALLQILVAAPSVELFRNLEEFQEAKEYVYSNGPEDMKLRLKIDKIDRKLAEKTWSDAMRDLFTTEKSKLLRELLQAKRKLRNNGDGIAMQPLKNVLAKRTDLHGLPLTMGAECRSDVDETRDLSQVSSSVGRTIARFNGSLGSRDAAQNDAFRNLFIKQMVSSCMEDHAAHPTSQKVKTIDQILQIDHPRLRLEMIEALGKSGTDAAVKVLVNKAKFDLEPEVRNAAIQVLADIDAAQYRESLLEGLNYPWHVVAEHSAEALVRLNDQDAIPSLVDMLDLPHPQFPIQTNRGLVQRELVGINHMQNCLLCHAPSTNQSDSVRGLIPHLSRPLPPHYYDSRSGSSDIPFAVRADITYLEQDFSVVRPVEEPGPWPHEQRFDYVVQKKQLTPKEAELVAKQISHTPNRNRLAVIFALQELTGETPADNSSDNWRSIMAGRQDNGK